METITTALSTAFTTMSTDFFGILAVALPIGIGIVGAVFGIKKAISTFTKIANKG